MVEVQIGDNGHTGQIILTPNFSSSWQANLYLLYILMAISMTISLGFLLVGAWVILPCSLLELIAFALCLYYCVHQCHRQEVIIIREHEVLIEKGIKRPNKTWSYHRPWAKFLIKPAKHPGSPRVVSIISHGQDLELGSFLNSHDKQQLIIQLKRVVTT